MKKKKLINFVCIAMLIQYGIAPINALAAGSEETVVETTNSETINKDPLLSLPMIDSSGEEATNESTEETTEAITTESKEGILNWEFRDTDQEITTGDDFTLKIKGTLSVAKIELPKGITYYVEKNVEELRSVINFDKETRELTLTQIDEYEEINLVLTTEKAGDFELQMTNEVHEKIGDKLVLTVAEKMEEAKESTAKTEETDKKEEAAKKEDSVKKVVEKKEETPKKEKTVKKAEKMAVSDESVKFGISSNPTDEIQNDSEYITYKVNFAHDKATDTIKNGKLNLVLENGHFLQKPSEIDNIQSITFSADKRTAEVIFKDNWQSGNLDSLVFSVKADMGLQTNDTITLKGELTGEFSTGKTTFLNSAEKKVQFKGIGTKVVQPNSTSWKVLNSTSTSTSTIDYTLSKINNSEGFTNLRIKVKFSDKNKVTWFKRLFEGYLYKADGGVANYIEFKDDQIEKIDDRTFMFNFGELRPETVDSLRIFLHASVAQDAVPEESVDIDIEYYNEDKLIYKMPVYTVNAQKHSGAIILRSFNLQTDKVTIGEQFGIEHNFEFYGGSTRTDTSLTIDIPQQLNIDKILSGMINGVEDIVKVEYYDGKWHEVSPDKNKNFYFSKNNDIQKLKIYFVDTGTGNFEAVQPFRTFYSVKTTAKVDDSLSIEYDGEFTDSEGKQQIDLLGVNPTFDVVSEKKVENTTVGVKKYTGINAKDFDSAVANLGETFIQNYRIGAVKGEIDQPYIFVKLPKGIKLKNRQNILQYAQGPYDSPEAPANGKDMDPVSEATDTGQFLLNDGSIVYYFKATDTKLKRERGLRFDGILLIENEYTVDSLPAGDYEVEVGMGSLNNDYSQAELNEFTTETLPTALQTKLGATASAYYSNKTKLVVGQEERLTTNVKVKGSEDNSWKDASKGEVGTVTPGKKVDYKIVMKNEGTESYQRAELINILPHVGDTLVSSSTPRGSEFQVNPNSSGAKVFLNGKMTNNVALQYSMSNNPERFSSPNGTPIPGDSWVSSVSDFSKVRAIKVSVIGETLNPGDELTLEYSGNVALDAKRPENTTESVIAKNSVAYKLQTTMNEIRVGEPVVSSVKTTKADKDGQLTGITYVDLNKNGNKDTNEPYLNQVKFELFKESSDGEFVSTGETVESSPNSTGRNGVFGFNDLGYGTYKVKVTLPKSEGAKFITAGTDGLEIINDTTAWLKKGKSTELVLNDSDKPASVKIDDLRVPLFVYTPLSGNVAFKNNEDQVITTDYGKDFKVELLDNTNKKIAETTSKENGRYSFDELSISSESDYKVKVTIPSGKEFVFTADNINGEKPLKIESGVGVTEGITDIYITDSNNPTGNIELIDGYEADKNVNPTNARIKANDASTDFNVEWKIINNETTETEYSDFSNKATTPLKKYIGYLIGDKKAGTYTVEAVVTDAAGNSIMITKQFILKFGTVQYKVDSTEYAKEEDLFLYVDKLSKPKTAPAKAGYEFDQWVTDDDTAWDFNNAIISEENLVLNATFKAIEQTITFDENGGDKSSKPADIKKDTDTIIDLGNIIIPTRTGYTFKYWYQKGDARKADVGASITMPAGGMVLVAEWKANSYKVIFDKNGGTGTMEDQEFKYDTDQRLAENTFKRDNYQFIGWATEQIGDAKYSDKESIKNLTSENDVMVILYAVWEKETTRPIIKANNIILTTDQVKEFKKKNILDKKIAEFSDAKVINETTNDVIASHKELDVETSNVKEIKGFYKAKISYTAKARTTVDSKDIDVTVIEPTETQKITFDVNGGDEKSKPKDISASVGTTVSLKDIKDPTKSGYIFIGWFNGKNKVGETVEMPENGMKLVAHWSNASTVGSTNTGLGTTKKNTLIGSGTSTSASEKSFPKTNDTSTIGLSILGMLLIILSYFGLRKKKENESK